MWGEAMPGEAGVAFASGFSAPVAPVETPALESVVHKRSKTGAALVAVSVAVDVLAILGGYLLAGVARAPLPDYRAVLLGTVALWPVVFSLSGLYDHRRLSAGWLEMRRIFGGVSLGMFAVIFVSFLADQRDLSRGWTVAAWPACLATVTVARFVVRRTVHGLRRRGRLQTRVVVVGTNPEARSIARTLLRDPGLGSRPVGFVRVTNGHPIPDTDDCSETLDGLPVLGWTSRITEAVRRAGAEAVLVASTATPGDKLAVLYRDLQDAGDIDVRISAGVLNIAASRMDVEPLDGLPVLALRRIQLARSQAALKRAFDVGVSSLIAVALAPALLLIAVAVKLTSRGPVLFRQHRVGLNGRPFRMLKFRTMYVGAEDLRPQLADENEADGLLFKLRDDPRVTRIGRVMRRYSLDELPQIFNVLRGDMSLVGPRPPLPEEVEGYDAWLRGRLHVTPGITGLWQVSGRHELTFEDYVRYDLFYARNWSLALDLSILWRTIPAVLTGRGSW